MRKKIRGLFWAIRVPKKQIPKSIFKKIIQESCTKIGTILHQTQLLKLFFDSHCIDIFFNSCDFFYLFFVGLKWKKSFGKFLILKFIFIVLFTSGWGVENLNKVKDYLQFGSEKILKKKLCLNINGFSIVWILKLSQQHEIAAVLKKIIKSIVLNN